MSIRWMRTGQIKNGRVMEAMAWSMEVCGWVEKKHNIKVHTWMDAVGSLGTIRWTVDYPDMAAFDKVMTAVNMDPDYHKFVAKAFQGDLFIDGVGVDTLSKQM